METWHIPDGTPRDPSDVITMCTYLSITDAYDPYMPYDAYMFVHGRCVRHESSAHILSQLSRTRPTMRASYSC